MPSLLERLRTSPSGQVSTGRGASTFGTTADSSLLNRNSFVSQQVGILNSLGPSARKALYAASPDYAALSDYVTKTLADPLGGMTDIYRDQFRSAMAARGLEYGGEGVAAGEARHLTELASQARQQVAPLALQTTQMLMQAGGMTADYGQSASLREQTRQYEIERDLVRQQAEESRKMYEKEQAELERQKSLVNMPAGGSPFGTGGKKNSSRLFYSGGSGSNYLV